MAIFTALATAITSAFFAIAGAFGATLATAGLALAGTIIGYVGAALIYGGVAILSSSLLSKKSDYASSSPTYSTVKQTQTNPDLPIPLLYGRVKVAGNRLWQDDDYSQSIKRIVAFAEGEIEEFEDIRLNDIEASTISGIKIEKFYGTSTQGLPSFVKLDDIGSLKNVAYLAISVPRSDKIDINYNLTTIVRGRKIRVYITPTNYIVTYSANPAWVLFDFLTCYNGMGLALDNQGNISDELIEKYFDLNSFIEAAAFCHEQIKYTNNEGKEITEPRFSFNMIFDSQTSARTLLDEIYRNCRGVLATKNGKLQFKIDKAQPVKKVFQDNDILAGSEQVEMLPYEEHYDILKIDYISPDHEWQKIEAFAELPEYRDGAPIEHVVNCYSCTSFQQASRLAWYYVNAKRLQPYFGSFQTGFKAWDLEIGDVIKIPVILMGFENYLVKVTSVIDNGTGVFTVNWSTYDERLYSDTLGSLEPTVVVGNISDQFGIPDDVKNFNVIQNNNTFNFNWQHNEDYNITYEIRAGETWENGFVIASALANNKYTSFIESKGLYKFWIKAFNGYNYSKNATLDVLSVISIPNMNEIIREEILTTSGAFENTYLYQGKLKLATTILWENLEDTWKNADLRYYAQSNGRWGANVVSKGTYTSTVYDTGRIFENTLSFSYDYYSADNASSALIEIRFSDDNITWTEWRPLNTGQYKFRYYQIRVTLTSPNNAVVFLEGLVVVIDIPDKEEIFEVNITDAEAGYELNYDFVKTPSIVGTVNDTISAYIVVELGDDSNKRAIIKAYTNNGVLTTCKASIRVKGY